MIQTQTHTLKSRPRATNSGGFIVKILQSVAFRLKTGADRLDKATLKRCLQKAGAGQAGAIPTWTTWRELKTLHQLASECPDGAAALEIGSYLGASSCYLAMGLARQNGRLYCVDTWQNDTIPDGRQDTFAAFMQNTEAFRPWIVPVRKRSEEISEADVPGCLHLVFLDGDHSYEAVKGEWERFAPRIAENGILVFHDAIAFEGVARVIGEALASRQWQFAGNMDNLIWLRRIVWSEPTYNTPSNA